MIGNEKDLQALAGEELDLVVELLEAERRDLPSEIRRTGEGAFRDRLHHRLHVVDALLHRLHPAEPHNAS